MFVIAALYSHKVAAIRLMRLELAGSSASRSVSLCIVPRNAVLTSIRRY